MSFSIKQIAHSVFAGLLLSLSFVANAQHDAHVHGLATLMMALDGDEVEIQFESPAANIVGFEHMATTAEQIGSVEAAEALLESPEGLFSFSGSSCELQESTVDLSGVMDDEHHDDHAAHEDEDEHHTEEAHDDHEEHEGHSEIVANYHFICDDVSKITAISVSLFEQFSGLEEINAMWVTATEQGAESLNAENSSVPLR